MTKKVKGIQIPWRFWEKEKEDPKIRLRADIEMLESIRKRYEKDRDLNRDFVCIIKTLKQWLQQ